MLAWLEHLVFAAVVAVLIKAWLREGVHGVVNILVAVANQLPWYRSLVHGVVHTQVQTFTKQVKGNEGQGETKPPAVDLPEKGVPYNELEADVEKLKSAGKDPHESKLFAYVYTGQDGQFDIQKKAYALFEDRTGLTPEHDQLLRMYREAFMHENALNPIVFPTLRRFETEVISMTASMLHGDANVVGSMTSGGTESILMALKTYRDRARALRPHIKHPEMVAPITIHPAHEKAAEYFGITIMHVPVDRNGLPDVNDIRNAISSNTIALLASAPHYCHGVVDPVPEIAKLAVQYDLPMHVDACFGGFMLPWVEKLGYSIPTFDFRNQGVTSMSADIHKYGFGCKGSSVVLYRDDSYRQYQIFAYSGWPGGLFGSPGLAGTRPGGSIAAAWVALKAMGRDGYTKMAKQLMDVTVRLKHELTSIPGLQIIGNPHMTCFALTSNDPKVDIMAVADGMEERGWTMERQQKPNSLHFSILPHHDAAFVDKLVGDFREVAEAVKANKMLAKKGTAAMYGMIARIPDNAVLDEFIVQFFSELYKL